MRDYLFPNSKWVLIIGVLALIMLRFTIRTQFNASLLWNLPLGRLTYKGDIKQWNAQIALQQNKAAQFKNQYQQEIANATAEVQIANEQIIIAKEAVQSASEALYQSTERQKLGTAKPFEAFQVQQYYYIQDR
jgi:outer membrane protein TolC